MHKEEQKQFIESLINSMKDNILEKSDRFPENWTAYEIRTYIKERFEEIVWTGKELKGKQKKEYKNDCMTNNL